MTSACPIWARGEQVQRCQALGLGLDFPLLVPTSQDNHNPRPRTTINLLAGRRLQADFCSWLAFHAESDTSPMTTSAALPALPCPNKYQRQGFALLIAVPFLQFLRSPTQLHSNEYILADEALAFLLEALN